MRMMNKNGIMVAHALGHKMTGSCCFHDCPLLVFGSPAFIIWTTTCKYIDFD